MPDEKIDQKRPAHGESELRKMQQRLVDDTVDDSFPASDPPAWTTTGSKSVAARCDPDDTGPSAAPGEGAGSGEGAGPAGRAARRAAQAFETGRRSVADRLPQGREALRRGRDTVARPVEAYPLAALALSGAAGFALAWWIFGRAPAGRPLPAYGRRPGGMRPAERRRAEAHLAQSSRAAGAAGGTPDSF